MLQAIENPVRKLSIRIGKHENQFCELIKEINFGCKKLQAKKWNLAQYFNHMGEFFDYIGLPADAEEHRQLADKWILDNSAI